MSLLGEIKEKIEIADSIVIITHENPDGDAYGSTLACALALKQLGKNPKVIIPEKINAYSFLPGFDLILEETEEIKNDLCIALDSSDIERLHVGRKYFENAKNTIVIDHHITNQNYGDINYLNSAASSTCQNLMVIFAAIGVKLDKEIAECIYTGMLADTGGFRYNVQSETFEFAAILLETGINIARIYRILYDIRTETSVRLLGRALNTLEMHENGLIAVTYITQKDIQEVNAVNGDQENIVYYGRDIEGVEVSVFIREKEDGKYKVSLRANDYVDVAIIAIKFAGGGHKRAAGFELSMSLDMVKATIIDEIKKQLK